MLEAPSRLIAAPAFPTAQGFGTQTVAGRGSVYPPFNYTVHEVWTLQDVVDDGNPATVDPPLPYSLRAAIEAGGPRIVVFRVAGTIQLKRPLQITNSHITIAGQTAPYPGITLRQVELFHDGSFGGHTLQIRTHDVVIRYLRVRPGRALRNGQPLEGCQQDAIAVARLGSTPVYNVVLDHVSASWGTDENIDVNNGASGVTLQHSFISEPLYLPAASTPIDCGFNMLVGQAPGVLTENVSIHHNLMVHARERAPSSSAMGLLDIVNNVHADYARYGSVFANCEWTNLSGDPLGCKALPPEIDPETDRIPINWAYNFFKRGPSTPTPANFELFFKQRIEDPANPDPNDERPAFAAWIRSNLAPNRTDFTEDQLGNTGADMTYCSTVTKAQETGSTPVACDTTSFLANTRHATPSAFVRAEPLTPALLERIRDEAGASQRVTETGTFVAARDAIDTRVAADVGSLDALTPDQLSGASGGIVSEPPFDGELSSPWPDIVYYHPLEFDEDHDGLPSAWETAQGLNPRSDLTNPPSRDDNLDADYDGYTNLEEYLNGTDPGDWDNDGIRVPTDNCPLVANATQIDSDGDGAGNACDNCLFTTNQDQRDTNADGRGNRCDPDVDDDGDVDTTDLNQITSLQGQTQHPAFAHADLDGNGAIDFADVAIWNEFNLYYATAGAGRPGPGAFVDSDADGILDGQDNCVFDANGPDALDAGGLAQRDVDQDGFGNICDPDVGPSGTGDGYVTSADADSITALNALAGNDSNRQRGDLNANDAIDLNDYGILYTFLIRTPPKPGPSAYVTPAP